jgi:hypothetical protein
MILAVNTIGRWYSITKRVIHDTSGILLTVNSWNTEHVRSGSLTCECGTRMSGRQGGQCFRAGSIRDTAHTAAPRTQSPCVRTSHCRSDGIYARPPFPRLPPWETQSLLQESPHLPRKLTAYSYRKTESITPWSRVVQQLKNCPTFHGY